MARKTFCFLGLVLVIGALLVGCASIVAITPEIIDDINDLEKMGQFQYYVSRDIVLTKVQKDITKNEIIYGKLVKKDNSERNEIQIGKSTQGLVKGYSIDKENNRVVLQVAFEHLKDGTFPTISFSQYLPGPKSKFYILYTNSDTKILMYAGEEYKVGFSTTSTQGQLSSIFDDIKGQLMGTTLSISEPPHLLIKMKKSMKQKNTYRRAGGLKL